MAEKSGKKQKRSFLIVILISFLLSGIPAAFGQTGYPLAGHPRLFFLASDETAMKEKLKNDPELNKVHNLILTECNKMLTLPVQQRVLTGKRLLSVSRETIRRITFLSYGYRMTGDTFYAGRAETKMLTIASFPDWNLFINVQHLA